MKKILGVSLVALMAVNAAHANIASEAWVEQNYATNAFVSGSDTLNGFTATTVVGAVNELKAGATAGASAIQGVKVNGSALTPTEGVVDVTVPTGALASQDSVTSALITNGTIIDEDVNASAAIAGSKIALTGYTKGSDATALAATDTVNAAMGKLENQISAVATTAGNALTSDSALNGAKITAGTVPETALDSTTQGKIDGALQSSTASTTYATKAEVGDTSGLATTYGSGNDTVVKALAAVAATANGALTSNNITASGNENKIVQYDANGLVTAGTKAGALAVLDAVSSTEITDGTIVNADISSTAAIAMSKIAMPTTTGSDGVYVLTGTINGDTITYKWEQITRAAGAGSD